MRKLRKRAWGKVFLGCFIGSLALGATAIDVWNNHDYGASISPAMAAVMVLAALGLTAIPGVAAIRGWNGLRVFGTAVCLVTTAYCAVNAYAARQSAQIMAAEAQSTRYADAREAVEIAKRDVRNARTKAAEISEPLSAEQLQKLHDAADKRARDEATDARKGASCGTLCRAAEAERDAYLPRIAQAKAKEEILKRADEAEKRLHTAKEEAAGGNAEANMIASQIASYGGGDANVIARFIAVMMAGLGIAVTLAVAGYMHDAVMLIVEGLKGEEVEIAEQVEEPKPEPEPVPVEAEAAKVTEVETAPAKDLPQLDPLEWLKVRLRPRAGGTLDLSDLHARYSEDAASQGMSAATPNRFGRKLTELGFARSKSGPRTLIMEAGLKPAQLKVVGG